MSGFELSRKTFALVDRQAISGDTVVRFFAFLFSVCGSAAGWYQSP
jgi:hypothetical protein